MKKWIFIMLPIGLVTLSASHRAAAFTYHQRRCTYAQRQHGKDHKTFFTKVNCPYGVVSFVPKEVWQKDVDGYTTMLVKCYSNDCTLTQQLIRKYSGINDRLPSWDLQTR